MAACPHGFRISAYLQELMVFIGSDFVFEEASQTLEKLLGIKVSAKQIERVSEKVGHILEEELDVHPDEHGGERPDTVQAEPSGTMTDYHYVQMDGSMLLTREDKWREVKLGRVFSVPVKEALGNQQPKI